MTAPRLPSQAVEAVLVGDSELVDDVDTSFDVSSDIILPNDSDNTFLKGFNGDRTSSGSRGLPSNVSFYPDGTSSPQQKR